MARIPTKAEILEWISAHPTQTSKRDIAKAFGIKGFGIKGFGDKGTEPSYWCERDTFGPNIQEKRDIQLFGVGYITKLIEEYDNE